MIKKIISNNKKIHLECELKYKLEAGIVLNSDEVKSLRAHSPSLQNTYCYPRNGELFINNLKLYNTKIINRTKKLLLHKKEILKIQAIYSNKGYSIFVLQLYETNRGIFKILIAPGKALKLFQSKNKLKARDLELQKKIEESDW